MLFILPWIPMESKLFSYSIWADFGIVPLKGRKKCGATLSSSTLSYGFIS